MNIKLSMTLHLDMKAAPFESITGDRTGDRRRSLHRKIVFCEARWKLRE